MLHTTSSPMSSGDNKGKNNNFSHNEQSILGILRTGGAYSAKELGRRTSDRDPRSTIRYLRKRGIPVMDVWVSSGGPRYKHYFLGSSPLSHQLTLFQ